MKFNLVSLAVLSACVSALPIDESFDTLIPNQYIISFNSDVGRDGAAEAEHYEWLDRKLNQYNRGTAEKEYGVLHKYSIGQGFKGYSAKVPESLADLIKEMPLVSYIEQDSQVQAYSVQSKSGSWGLSRVSQRALPLNESYTYPDKSGEGTFVYVIDTGVEVEHPDFEGRAIWGETFSKDGFVDGNGHGTHCAGTVAGATFGVAKKATIVAVKVLDNSGSGSFSGVIAGVNWMANNATKSNLVGKALASMSLGGGRNKAINDAVAAAVKAGFPFSVAAGNSYKADACRYSPASEPLAYTVAASDINDKLARFSNVGPCVDIIAPGVDIASAWIKNTTRTISGTSMAAPHVAGVMALALAEKSFKSPQDLYDFMSSNASPDAMTELPPATVNLLLFNGIDTFPASDNVVGNNVDYEEYKEEFDPLEEIESL